MVRLLMQHRMATLTKENTMPIVKTLSLDEFARSASAFSYEAAEYLFNDLNDIYENENWELDTVALSMDWHEYDSIEDLNNEYGYLASQSFEDWAHEMGFADEGQEATSDDFEGDYGCMWLENVLVDDMLRETDVVLLDNGNMLVRVTF